MSVGKILKKIRKEKGMTQVEFAKHLDMSRSFIGDIENDRYVPNPNTIKKLSEKLGISTYYLTTGEKLLIDLLQEDDHYVPQDDDDSRLSATSWNFGPEKYEERLKKDLLELTKIKMSESEHSLLRLTLTFMWQSTAKEMDDFSVILRALATNRNAHQRDASSYNNENRLEKADGVTERFREFVYSYYKITEDSD